MATYLAVQKIEKKFSFEDQEQFYKIIVAVAKRLKII